MKIKLDERLKYPNNNHDELLNNNTNLYCTITRPIPK